MTQEEIEKQAEIYTKEKHCKECRITPTCWEYSIENCCTACRRTNEDFIAGAKGVMEHAIQWHDLRENPSDLPKENGEYWCKYSNNTYHTAVYDKKFRYWFSKYKPHIVIAWCELPQFKE